MTLLQEGDSTHLRQTFVPPVIYFDHWAICEFSDSVSLQDRLVAALHRRRGTFLLSHTNLAEFTKADDRRHAEAAEVLLDRLMPHVYLTDFDLEKAEAFEAAPANAGLRLCPSPDLPMLRFLASRSIQTGPDLTFRGFITLSHEFREPLRKTFQISNQNVLNLLNKKRAEPAYVAQARASIPSDRRSKTRVVLGELMRELTIDPKAEITLNDIADWQHSALPLSCCDFVLLDGKWEQRALAMKSRFEAHGFSTHLAQCFSKRNSGLENFLLALEAP